MTDLEKILLELDSSEPTVTADNWEATIARVELVRRRLQELSGIGLVRHEPPNAAFFSAISYSVYLRRQEMSEERFSLRFSLFGDLAGSYFHPDFSCEDLMRNVPFVLSDHGFIHVDQEVSMLRYTGTKFADYGKRVSGSTLDPLTWYWRYFAYH